MALNRKRMWLTGALAGMLTVLGALLWSTRYEYSELRSGSSTLPVRTSWLTGESEWLLPGTGWTQMGPSKEAAPTVGGSTLSVEELSKVKILHMEYERYGAVSGEIYNGSRYRLKHLKLRMTQSHFGKTVLSRALESSVDIAPGYSGQFLDGGVSGVPSDGIRKFTVEVAIGEDNPLGAEASGTWPIAVGDGTALTSAVGPPDARATDVQLGQFWKETLPGEFDDVSDALLGQYIRETQPGFGETIDLGSAARSGSATGDEYPDYPPTVADLGRMTREKYPGSYDDLDVADLGRRVRAKYAPAYDEYVETVADLGNFYIKKHPERHSGTDAIELGRRYRLERPDLFGAVLDIQE